jgi:Tol biopolymer transport system component
MKAIKRQVATSVLALAFLACGGMAYGGEQTALSTVHKHTSKKFAFLRYVGEWGGEFSQLYTVRSNGSDLTAVGPLRRYDFASLSPDDSKIVTAVWQTSAFGADCAIMNVDGSGFAILVANTELATGCTTPSFSSDGRKIVFSMNNDLMMMNVDGSGRVVVLPGGFTFRPTFTRDGKAILANLSGELYLVSVEGGGRTLGSTLNASEATFSADGTKIFFNSAYYLDTWPPQLPTSQLFVMNADGTNVEQLTFGGLNISPLVVGNKVIFASDRAAPFISIFGMRTDGTGVRIVVRSPQWDAFNSLFWWNPDNRGD